MKYVYIALAFVFLVLGAIGIWLPVLPTTPFLLLASFFFAKGSEKIDRWFKGTKIYTNHLESFEKSRSMTIKTKLTILIPVSLMLGFLICKVDNIYMRGTLVIVIAIKYWYFFARIKTVKTVVVQADNEAGI
ncbi:MAG: DUF454 domain-containing protein [Tissierellia bacterium]|nr:DUF454 domain-containing protein [Tissierellia bacterium]